MSEFFFVFRELLGAIRARSAALLGAAGLLIFLCLASFAALLLVGGGPTGGEERGLMADEIVVDLSPRLSADAVNALYRELQRRPDVVLLAFRFAQEVSPESTGGQFFIRTSSPEVTPDVLAAVESMSGITGAEAGTIVIFEAGFTLTGSTRIGLLVALVLSVVLSLVLARSGFRALLETFQAEIRVLRLSGVSERRIVPPVVGLGTLLGLLSGLLLIVGVYIAQYALGEGASSVSELANGGRVLVVVFADLILGLLLGSLVGLLGASLLSSREFSPLP